MHSIRRSVGPSEAREREIALAIADGQTRIRGHERTYKNIGRLYAYFFYTYLQVSQSRVSTTEVAIKPR